MEVRGIYMIAYFLHAYKKSLRQLSLKKLNFWKMNPINYISEHCLISTQIISTKIIDISLVLSEYLDSLRSVRNNASCLNKRTLFLLCFIYMTNFFWFRFIF